MNDQLLSNAQIIREDSRHHNQRLLNNLWLTLETHKHYQGGKALTKWLTRGVLSYRQTLAKQQRFSPVANALKPLHAWRSTGSSGYSTRTETLSYYDIELSSSSLTLSYHIKL